MDRAFELEELEAEHIQHSRPPMRLVAR
jgi:hypothetical protein